MAKLTWTKTELGYQARGEWGSYAAFRSGGRFELWVDGELYRSRVTLANAKDIAQTFDDDRGRRVGRTVEEPTADPMKTTASTTLSNGSSQDGAPSGNGDFRRPEHRGDGPDAADPMRPEAPPADEMVECERGPACLEAGAAAGERCEVCGGTVPASPTYRHVTEPAAVLVGTLADVPELGEDEATELARPEATADRLRLEERGVTTGRWQSQQPNPAPDRLPRNSTLGYCEEDEPDCCEGAPGDESCPGCGKPARPEAKPTSDLVAKLTRPTANGQCQPPHVIVIARAGTGKTTTLVSGLQVLKGLPPTDAKGRAIVPSPQQKAVWDAIAESADARTVCFAAFNNSIAEELKTRVPAGCEAMTMHSMGYKAVNKQFGYQKPNEWAVKDSLAVLFGCGTYREAAKAKPVEMKAAEDLVSLVKQTLAGYDFGTGRYVGVSDEELDNLVRHYGVELSAPNGCRRVDKAEVYRAVADFVRQSLAPNGRISFDDMIWLPVVHNLPLFRYDLLLVDEAQDLNRCQQTLAKMAGKRLVLCGDPAQAIYGFAGADSQSMPRMTQELTAGPAGCVTLPLTVTRRCGKAIVAEAKRFVPDFEAHESNAEGDVSEAMYPIQKRGSNYWVNGGKEESYELPWEQTYGAKARPGDFVVCRVNAPLVSQCFKFLKRNVKATIQGRDIGKGIADQVKKLTDDRPGTPVAELVERLGEWYKGERAKEEAKAEASEMRLTALEDRFECLSVFCEEAKTAGDVLTKIDQIFTNRKDEPGVRLSSIHKAKGLEADRVFYLKPDAVPQRKRDRMKAWEIQQEDNLEYVAITRAAEELVYVY